MSDTVRIGVLGAAWIAPSALIQPARDVAGVEVIAIAARDSARAKAFARRHRVPTIHDSYDALINDPALDAVYIPLPNSLHAHWTLKALEAGKHVLCEKPLASNEAEARSVVEKARVRGLVLFEAMHYRFHPLCQRLKERLTDGSLGTIQRIETWACFPIFRTTDIRYRLELGGGALMDLGCYAVNLARFLAGAEPVVQSAQARLQFPNLDRWASADLAFSNGCEGKVICSLWSTDFIKGEANVVTDRGTLRIVNPYAPHLFHSMKWTTNGTTTTEKLPKTQSTSHYQLQAFVDAIRGDKRSPVPADDAVNTMRVIDAIYRKAGLTPRGGESIAAPSTSVT